MHDDVALLGAHDAVTQTVHGHLGKVGVDAGVVEESDGVGAFHRHLSHGVGQVGRDVAGLVPGNGLGHPTVELLRDNEIEEVHVVDHKRVVRDGGIEVERGDLLRRFCHDGSFRLIR